MVSKVTFKIKLSDIVDTKGLSTATKNEIKKEVGEFVVDKILADTSKQTSAVTGQRWKGLSKDYKKEKSRLGVGVANLELHGDMLDALKSVNYRDGIEVGVFDNEQAQKADNHNKVSSKSLSTPLPKRQFIPNKGETLRKGIMRDVIAIAKEIADDAPETKQRIEKAKESRKAALAALREVTDDNDQN